MARVSYKHMKGEMKCVIDQIIEEEKFATNKNA